jgi:hypothetical protein
VVASSCGYSAWDETGARVATTTLNGAGTSGDSCYAHGIANSMFFVFDGPGGSWPGYDAI